MNNKSIKHNLAQVKITDLLPWDKNPRTANEADKARLRQQIETLGVYKPLLAVKKGSGYEIIGGNMRYEVLRNMGIETVWVNIIEPKNDAEKVEIAFSDNDSAGIYIEDELRALLLNAGIESDEMSIYKVDTQDTNIALSLLMDDNNYQLMEPEEIGEDDELENIEETLPKLIDYIVFKGEAGAVKSLKESMGFNANCKTFTVNDLRAVMSVKADHSQMS